MIILITRRGSLRSRGVALAPHSRAADTRHPSPDRRRALFRCAAGLKTADDSYSGALSNKNFNKIQTRFREHTRTRHGRWDWEARGEAVIYTRQITLCIEARTCPKHFVRMECWSARTTHTYFMLTLIAGPPQVTGPPHTVHRLPAGAAAPKRLGWLFGPPLAVISASSMSEQLDSSLRRCLRSACVVSWRVPSPC